MKQIAIFNQEQRKIIHKFADDESGNLSEFMLGVMKLINSYKEGSVILKSKFQKQTGVSRSWTNKLFTFLSNNRVLAKVYSGTYGSSTPRYTKTKFELTKGIMEDAIEKTGFPEHKMFDIPENPESNLGHECQRNLAQWFFGVTVYREGSTVFIRFKNTQSTIPEAVLSFYDFKFFSGDGIKYAYLQMETSERAEITVRIIGEMLIKSQAKEEQ